ncbi:MAG: c-type cytochrome [Planctomycetota bacterium]|nr:c-type cytochrome [Planctomycetota bacterium]
MSSLFGTSPIKLLLRVAASILFCSGLLHEDTVAADNFSAGAFAKNISPVNLPVWVNGGISGRKIDRITDALNARCLVLSDGKTQVAICIVDNCILPLEIIDKAKELTQSKTGIAPNRILIAATHTHSAVSVVGTHGTPVQQDYADALPGWIAEGVAEAQKRMVPAQWGTTSVVCDQYIYCRDWLMKPGTANSSPFSGRTGDLVSMNPGHDNPNKMAPIGPVDTLVPILSIQDRQGKPISVLASFCTHYAGAPNISSDYFGVVCERLAKSLSPNSTDSFVGLMANATSGNANCIDFSKPAAPFTHVEVGTYVSDKILSVLPGIQYTSTLSLDAELDSIDLDVRMPNAADVAAAKKYMETHFPDRLPATMDENYARETVLLSEMPPTRKLNLQAIRLNDFAIVANPCESYNETGLKIRQASPFRLTMNIGLANGHAGYIPPPELFQLGGYTTWRCRSSCLEEHAEPKMVEGLTRVMRALHARQVIPVPVSKQTKPQSPVSPMESLQWLEVEPGFKVELVASEPQIVDPVSMQIDKFGRMWVVEMRDYPTEDDAPKSRIVVLEDKNRDGFFESATVFADNLRFATGVQPWENGALVTVQGQLVMLRDMDGDLKSDSTEVWLDGFAIGNPQLRANHPTLSADGWIYIASGLRGGKIKSTLPFGKPTTEPFDLTGCDLRVNMLTGRIEGIAGPSQFGLTFDSFGNRYGCSNRNPCFEIVSERADLSISPLSGLAIALNDVSPSNAASKVHPLVNAWTTSNLHAGQFTAACGVLVSEMSAYTCEPTGALVQRRAIKRKDGLMQVTDEASEREWLASRDPWFRPVDLYEGPDGEVYVVDMYRAVIEHPDWVPAELKNRPDQRLGDSHGRIYRVTRTNKIDEKRAGERLLDNRHASLKDWLEHPDAWYRRMAAQTILAGAAKEQKVEYIETLRQVCVTPRQQPEVIANACWLLVACDGLDEATAIALLKSSNPELRSVAWSAMRESTTDWGLKWMQSAIDTFGDLQATNEELRSAAWFIAKSSSRISSESNSELNSSLMERYAILASQSLIRNNDPPHLWMAVTAAWRDNGIPFILQYKKTASDATNELSPIAREAIARLASRSVSQPSLKIGVQEFVNNLAQELSSIPRLAYQSATLAILDGIARTGRLTIVDGSVLEKIVQRFALSSENAINQRTAVSILAYSKSDSSKSLALELLSSPNVALLKTAIATCSAHDTPEFSSWLIERLPSALPEIRQDVFGAVRNNPQRLEMLVERFESGKLSTRILDASQIQSLSGVKDSAIATRLAKVLSGAINSNRQNVVDEYSKQVSSFEVSPDKNNGKAIFAKNCSACHKLDGVGAFVGPDISDSREQSYEKLLISVLDPNRSIDANYFRYLARTEDGSIVEGLLKDSNSQTVTLQSQNGALTTLNRSEIEELKSSGTSLMPEGIESQISVAEMAELLWYVKNWRYVVDNVPANASLKK